MIVLARLVLEGQNISFAVNKVMMVKNVIFGHWELVFILM